jgi:two-component system repressor protein LuxO
MNPGPALPPGLFGEIDVAPVTAAVTLSDSPAHSVAPGVDPQMFAGMTLDAIERIVIENAIQAANGSLPRAARTLGISPSTLYRKRERWIDGSADAA